jgi:hypothetical protein
MIHDVEVLQSVEVCLPHETRFCARLLEVLQPLGELDGQALRLRSAKPAYRPQLSLGAKSVARPEVRFCLEHSQRQVRLVNTTGEVRQNPERYAAISLADYESRCATLPPVTLDHVGFNLPWSEGVHPDIQALRQLLAGKSAYFLFPTGENWDFILPATAQELASSTIDLNVVRRPKLEMVSFDKSSTPLLQIDFMVRAPFERIAGLFPEGIIDRDLQNVWVYIENPFEIDVCFVVNPYRTDDWSALFAGNRLLG